MDGGRPLHHLNPLCFHIGSIHGSVLSMLNLVTSPKTSPPAWITGQSLLGHGHGHRPEQEGAWLC
jgi:hypothetical protein